MCLPLRAMSYNLPPSTSIHVNTMHNLPQMCLAADGTGIPVRQQPVGAHNAAQRPASAGAVGDAGVHVHPDQVGWHIDLDQI